MQTDQFPEITQKCENFKNHLANNFKIPQYGNFIGAYRFPIDLINNLLDSAASSGTPAYVKAYYGCNAQGEDHQLYLAVLDANDNVLKAQSVEDSQAQSSADTRESTASAALSSPNRCPPGCFADPIIGRLLQNS
jgi:hypothetical protein